MLDGVIVPVQQALFSVLYFIAVILWGLNNALLLVGYYVLTITSWLSEAMFQPLLQSIGNATDSLLLPIFTLAMLTLAITYLLGVFGVFRVVEFRSAIIWLFVAVLWFQFGPEIYLGFEQTRRELGGAFFATTFTDLTSGSGSIEGLSSVGDAGDLNINPPTNNFGTFLSFDTAIDGLDIGLAYLNADGCDVLRTSGCLTFTMPDGSTGALPTRWYTSGEYFDLTQHGFLYPGMTNEERQASLDSAAAGIWRGLSGIVVSLFGLLEQIVQLLLTIAFGIGFASFFIAVLFAFFKKTESVTWAVFDVILGLFIQSIITSLLLALVMAFVSVAGATGNGILLLGVGFIGIILVTVLLLGAVSAILKALNGLMGSFGAVTGGNLDAAGTVTKLAGAYATGGATLLAGGTVAQAAGSVLGPGVGQKAYYAAQTLGSDTMMGGLAQQVAQGSAASYLGPVGGYALGRSNQQSDDETETLPVKRSVNDLTLGTPIRSDNDNYYDTLNLRQRAIEGADIRIDPVSQQPYEFDLQNNGVGLRTYEDGSRLYTSEDDIPQNRERARDERRALRQQNDSDTTSFSQDAINRIDASDDDENAVLNSSIARLAGTLSANNTQLSTDSVNDSIVSVELTTSNTENDTLTTQNPIDPSPVDNSGEPILLESTTSTSDNASNSSDESTNLFLAEMERDFPGSTGRSDLVQQYFPDDKQSQAPQSQVKATESSSRPRLSNTDRSDDGVQSIRSIGPSTEEQLARINITTAGQLANANPTDISQSLERITPARANQIVNAAQAYVSPQSPPTSESSITHESHKTSPSIPQASIPNATQYAAAIDASNNDDNVRLATSISSAISTSLNAGRIPSTNQAEQIARDSGLPPVRESGQFVQVASAMNLSPQQAQGVIQNVQNTGQIGTEIATSIRASLSTLRIPATGQPLDDAGLSRAVANLERAAQALVGAANNIDGVDGNPSSGDKVNAGASTASTQTTGSDS